ncbi:hypothetical protein C480_14191 [Natrialba aegyptia DSM 13077]|uniref:Uncharacterized protein n=1 Tax=Natrialba aegyptia DSM 13077 TaxID=1227491 RepID=M0B4U5_9EURY|nr:hypothetical protein C480_14191 [Natrialba aegyptia DSM 13077]
MRFAVELGDRHLLRTVSEAAVRRRRESHREDETAQKRGRAVGFDRWTRVQVSVSMIDLARLGNGGSTPGRRR